MAAPLRRGNCCLRERRETFGKILKIPHSFRKLNYQDNVHDICKEVCTQMLKEKQLQYPHGVLRGICYTKKCNNDLSINLVEPLLIKVTN